MRKNLMFYLSAGSDRFVVKTFWLVSFVCIANYGLQPKAAENNIIKPRALTATVVRTNLARSAKETGEALPNREVSLQPRVSGFVKTVEVHLGQRVESGQLLATIEIPELESDLRKGRALVRRSSEEVNRAQALLDEASLSLKRTSAVAEQGAQLVAAQELDSAKVRLRVASATLAAANEQVEMVKADLLRLERLERDTKILSPFAGRVTRHAAVEGQWVTAGATRSDGSSGLFRISEVDQLRIVFPVASSLVRMVRVGSSATVFTDGIKLPLNVTVSRRSEQIDPTTRTMDIEADLPNPNGDISAGTYVTINWVIEVRTNILVIPTDAIVRGISPKVLRLGLNGVVEERAIKIGMQTSDSAEVLSGLAEGDLVAVGRLGSLRQGQQVDTSKPDSSAPPKKDVR